MQSNLKFFSKKEIKNIAALDVLMMMVGKYDCIKKSNPDKEIRILLGEDLINLGVDLKTKGKYE